MDPSRGITGVVIASCGTTSRGALLGSDSALLAALASGSAATLLVVRRTPWRAAGESFAGCHIRSISPPLGNPWLAGPSIRRDLGDGLAPVWAEERDMALLRGFKHAAVMDSPKPELNPIIDSIGGISRPLNEKHGEDSVVVLCSHPSRLDARGVVFAMSLASVAGRATRMIVPRGIRGLGSGKRYIRQHAFAGRLEAVSAPTWMHLHHAAAAIIDIEYERGTKYGPLLIGLAQSMGIPVVDIPGTIPVGTRDARRVGLPLFEALENGAAPALPLTEANATC